jgi:hypothetical protein
MKKAKEQIELASKGRPKKYDFSDLVKVGMTKTIDGADRNNVYGSAVAYSRDHQEGKWKFSCQSGRIGLKKVVVVKRIK